MKTPIAVAREVVAECQHQKIDGVLLDLFTAGAIVAVADACNADQLAKLDTLDLNRLVTFCWKCVK